MPTGYPKDPFAHAEKMRAKNAELLRIDEERVANGGPLKLKRTYKKRTQAATSAPTPINIGVGIEEDHAHTEKKNPIKRVHKKRVYDPYKTATPKKTATSRTKGVSDLQLREYLSRSEKLNDELQDKFEASQQTVKDLEEDLKALKQKYDVVVDAVNEWQETTSDMRLYLFAVLSLVANQK